MSRPDSATVKIDFYPSGRRFGGFTTVDNAVLAGFKAYEGTYQQLIGQQELFFLIFEYRKLNYYTSVYVNHDDSFRGPIEIGNEIKDATALVGLAHTHPPFDRTLDKNKSWEISFSGGDIKSFKALNKKYNFSSYMRTIYGNVVKLDKRYYDYGILEKTKHIITIKASSKQGLTTTTEKEYTRHYGRSICPNLKVCLPVYKRGINSKSIPA